MALGIRWPRHFFHSTNLQQHSRRKAQPMLILAPVTYPYQQILPFPEQLAWPPATRGMGGKKDTDRQKEGL
ncbi:Gag-Pol polyprotein, partial [Clarias magur]